jgi:hypothetical protein
MWTFLFSYLFLRRLGIAKPLRRVLLLALAVLFAAVLIYTTILFLTLEERTRAPHVPSFSSR